METDFFNGFVDFHNHILPGVDDGVQSLAETLEALVYFEKLNVGKIIFTPHVMERMGEAVLSHGAVFQSVKGAYEGRIELELAAEYMLDAEFEVQLDAGLRCLRGEEEALVETSYFSPPNHLWELLFGVATSGFVPVIAHPERYRYMNEEVYGKLKEKGYKLQLNLLSLSGHYGSRVQANALYLLREGMYDFVGTDLHSLALFQRKSMEIVVTSKQLRALFLIREQGEQQGRG